MSVGQGGDPFIGWGDEMRSRGRYGRMTTDGGGIIQWF
jgi:hypothetical protein